jgi:hypothetical protein
MRDAGGRLIAAKYEPWLQTKRDHAQEKSRQRRYAGKK